VRLVGMLPPQPGLGAILPGGGLVQAIRADRRAGAQPWGAGGLLVPAGPWPHPPNQGDAGRGSRITTAVWDDRLAAYASSCRLISDHLAHRRDRSAAWVARARTAQVSPTISTVASGCAWRLRHQDGSGSAQPFIASVTRFGPSWTKPSMALRGRRRATVAAVVVTRSVPSGQAWGATCPRGHR
jgi:hypothetical protein